MFCKKCGRPTEDDGIICAECAALEATQNDVGIEFETNSIPAYDKPVETLNDGAYTEPVSAFADDETFQLNTAGTVKQNKKSLGVIIGAIAGVVAVAAAVVIGLNWNKIFKPYDTPEEHMAYVESENANDAVDALTSGYGGLLNTINGKNTKSGGTSAQMHIKLSDDAIDLISSFTNVELDWANDVLINLDTAQSGEKIKAALGVGLGDTTIATLDYIVDIEKMMMYLAIPELSDTYLAMDLEDMMEDIYGGGFGVAQLAYAASTPGFEEYSELIEALPTEQELNKILKKYVGIAFKAMEDVESKPETITVDGISQKCTSLTITVTEEMLGNMLLDVLQTARSDKDLMKIVLRISDSLDMDLDEDDILDAIDEGIEGMEDALDEMDDDVLLELTDYVDSDEKIIGRCLVIEETDQEFYYLTATNKGKFAFEASFENIEITGNGTNKKDIIDAEYVLEVEDTEILVIELEKFNVKSFNSGNAVGTIRIKPSEEIAQQLMSEVVGVGVNIDVALELVFNNNATKKHMEFNVIMDDEFFAGITIDATTNTNSKVSIPKNTIDVTDEDELMEWAEDLDFDKILDNMKDAGVPREYIKLIERSLG